MNKKYLTKEFALELIEGDNKEGWELETDYMTDQEDDGRQYWTFIYNGPEGYIKISAMIDHEEHNDTEIYRVRQVWPRYKVNVVFGIEEPSKNKARVTWHNFVSRCDFEGLDYTIDNFYSPKNMPTPELQNLVEIRHHITKRIKASIRDNCPKDILEGSEGFA